MAQRRAAFRGTAEQWEALAPRILEEYLLGGDDDDEAARLAAKRAIYRSF